MTLLLSACGQSDTPEINGGQQPVAFDVYVGQTMRSGYVGGLSAEVLRQDEACFGVYAYETGSTTWAALSKSGIVPNFMYNQRVYWNADEWEYAPLKYWPNGSGTANDATGTGTTADYVTFYAYAPYAPLNITNTAVKDDPTADATYGITAINGCDGAPVLNYRLTDSDDDSYRPVDLLYATPLTDRTKQTVSGRLQFNFHHALSAIEFRVQRIYNDGTPGDMGTHEGETRIFVSQLKLTPTAGTYTSGQFHLADGTWSGAGGASTAAVTLDDSWFNDNVSGTTSADGSVIREKELNKYATGVAGVDATVRPLTKDASPFMLIPQTGVSFDIEMKYSFVTKDNELAMSTLTDYQDNKYGRIMNTVTANGVSIGDLLSGKKYIVLIKIGVENVTFEVIGVEEWYFPLRFTPSVTDYGDGGTSTIVGNES